MEELPPLLEAASAQGTLIFWIALEQNLYRLNPGQNLWVTDPLAQLDKESQDQVLFDVSKEIARITQDRVIESEPDQDPQVYSYPVRTTSDPDILTSLSHGELLALSEGVLAHVAQTRLDDLLNRNHQNVITLSEIDELDQMLQRVDHLNTLKAKARYTLEHLSTESVS